MPRTVSLAALQALLKQEMDEQFVEIIKIDHAELASPLRFVRDTQNITSGGDVYTAFTFQISLPPDDDQNPPSLDLIIAAVDQQIPSIIRSLTSAPTVDYSIIRVSTPDTIEVGPIPFVVDNVEMSHLEVRLKLGFHRNFLNEQFPKDLFAPYNAGNL